MFIHCFSEDLKREFIRRGFKLLSENENRSIFVLDDKVKFDFDKVDRGKFILTNRLVF